jgi:hypothetical protein
MSSAYPSPVLRQRFFDANGVPLVGGQLYSYVAGTSTLKNTYAGESLTSTNPNPVILDENGEASVWLSGSYKFSLYDANGNLQWTVDNITDVGTLIAAVNTALADTSNVANGDALVGVERTVSSFATTVHAWIEAQPLNVKADFGAAGDGSTDDTTKIQAALTAAVAGQAVIIPGGTYIISSTLTIPTAGVTLVGMGNPTIKAKNGAQFGDMIFANALSDLRIQGLIVDVNQSGRTSGLVAPLNGVALQDCTDCTVKDMTVRNAIGYNTASATGIEFRYSATGCTRCEAVNCRVENSGTISTRPCNAFVAVGTNNTFQGCSAYTIVGNGFYLDKSNFSSVIGCLANTVQSGVVITNSGSSDVNGNVVSGCVISAWSKTATTSGAIEVTCSSSGYLGYTSITGNCIYADTGASKGVGNGIYLFYSSTGGVKGTTITGNKILGVNGSGIYAQADDTLISGCAIDDITPSASHYGIYFTGSRASLVSGCLITSGASNIKADATSTTITVQGCFLRSASAFGVEAGTSSSLYSIMNNVLGYGTAVSAQSGSPTGQVIEFTQLAAALRLSSYVASAPSGSPSGYFPVVDPGGVAVGKVAILS